LTLPIHVRHQQAQNRSDGRLNTAGTLVHERLRSLDKSCPALLSLRLGSLMKKRGRQHLFRHAGNRSRKEIRYVIFRLCSVAFLDPVASRYQNLTKIIRTLTMLLPVSLEGFIYVERICQVFSADGCICPKCLATD